ncbi:MAG: universal stress protein [Bacteroidota bacterium]
MTKIIELTDVKGIYSEVLSVSFVSILLSILPMKTIVCPTDFSPCAENALQYADALAQPTQTRLIICHNVQMPEMAQRAPSESSSPAVAVLAQPSENALNEKMEKCKQALQGLHPANPGLYESTLTYGITSDSIPRLAEEKQADLIVMGTKGRHGLEGVIAGTMSAEIVEKAPCPVLIIPENASFQPLKHIVVATDLDENLSPEMHLIFELAQRFNAAIHFLHILDKDEVGARATAWEGFKKLQKTISYEKIAFYTNTREDLQKAIVEFSHVHDADLLVMIHHPRSFWQLSGSQTKQMAYYTQVPLLAIHEQLTINN